MIVDRSLYPGQFAADIPIEDARLAAATQRPIRDAALGEAQPDGEPAWRTLPSWFVFGSADKNIPVAVHRFLADRAASRKTLEVDGASHSVMVSHPDVVADLILEAVRSLR
ncbi:MAG: alpha/beta hydrolase [Actinomycetota bacterium]|nr:alpha/beta hydrolase [Actinomycetota bacterium]